MLSPDVPRSSFPSSKQNLRCADVWQLCAAHSPVTGGPAQTTPCLSICLPVHHVLLLMGLWAWWDLPLLAWEAFPGGMAVAR